MDGLQRCGALIGALVDAVGRVIAWLVPVLVLLVFGLVLVRYGLDLGSIAVQEAIQWLHGIIFMFGLAVALRQGRHVRVDVFQQHWSARRRAWLELIGGLLLLLPFAGLLLWLGFDYAAASWSMNESSREPGGLPALYLLKAVIPLAAALLALQGIAELLRALRTLRDPRR